MNTVLTLENINDYNFNNIKEVFEFYTSHVKINKELIDKIHVFERNFVNRNKEHIEFFGGKLMGVNRVRFTMEDRSRWIDDILGIDDIVLSEALVSLPSVNEDFQNVSDIFNHSVVWLLWKIKNSNLPKKYIHVGMVDTALVLLYRMLTSRLANDFRFTANPDLMEAVNEKMSNKFYIKKYKTWGGLLRARAEEIVSDNSIHAKTFREYGPDEKILYVITDIKTRLNSIVNYHWEVIEQIRESDSHIRKSKIFVQGEKGLELASLKRDLPSFRSYIHSITGDETSFIKDKLLDDVVYLLVATKNKKTGEWKTICKKSLVDKTLIYISEHHDTDKKIYQLVDDIMVHAFGIMNSLHMSGRKIVDLPLIATTLKGKYMASRTDNKLLIGNRRKLEQLIKRNFKGNSAAAVASTRTAVMLYIVLRAIAKQHYAA